MWPAKRSPKLGRGTELGNKETERQIVDLKGADDQLECIYILYMEGKKLQIV